MQYEIVRHMAAASGSLTIVGDPDQSIYSWRSAEVENLLHMMKGELSGIMRGLTKALTLALYRF